MKTIEEKVKDLLAGHVGTEASEIEREDSLREDIHLSSSELSDFMVKLAESGFAVDDLDMGNIQTVGDLIDALSSEAEL